MTARTISANYMNPQFVEFMEQGRKTKTKENYLTWVNEWKSTYARLSNDIRKIKSMRKPYLYDYRDRDDQTSKKRMNGRDNPDYDNLACMFVQDLKGIATDMIQARVEARKASWERKMQRGKVAA